MTAWVAMAVFGAVGALIRFQLALRWGARAILLVNLSGAFALGVLAGAGVSGAALLVVGTGFLGAYTTFSTWMVERSYLAPAIAGGFGLAWLGWVLGGAL